MNSAARLITAAKTGLNKALLVFAIFAIPIFGIKWGVNHRDFNWLRFYHRALAVHFSPDSALWSSSFSIEMPWQEKAAAIACTVFAAYVFFQLRLHIADEIKEDDKQEENASDAKETNTKHKRSFRSPENIFKFGCCLFLFLYVAACALCERTNLGFLNIEYDFASMYRDFGVIVLIVTMFLLTRSTVKQASFNGMLTRDDVLRAFKYLVIALGGLAICFCTWLPLFALPGVLIMIRFSLDRIKEIDYASKN